jgi:hypothetical protein
MTRAEGEEYEAETREGLMGAALAERHKVAAATERHRQDTARNRVVALALTRDRVFLEQFEEVCKAFIKPATPRGYALKKPSRKPSPRVLNLLLSDLHFGSDLDPSEGLQLFDAHVEARRLAWVVLQAAEFKRDHREETELHVHLIGDIIQNQLFDPRDGKPLAQQVLASMQYLGMAIEFLAQHFPKVVVRCTPGNHGRNKARHMQRATLQKWDAIETDVYAGTRAWCRTLKNVEFHIPKTPYYKVDYWGKKAFFTHGDTVIAPGNPGKSLNVGSMNAQIDALNARIVNLGEIPEQFSLVAVGHVHTGSVTHLPNGGVFLSNACLIPPDSYANTIGIFSCTCGQWLWESVPGHIIGDQRFITIDPKVDGDVSLEDIVAPYLPGDEL